MASQSESKTVVVIGAGVTGLTAAHALNRGGHRVLVLEQADRAGGVIRSTRDQGFLVEAGPNMLSLDDPALLAFLGDIGLRSEVVEANPDARRRFIVRSGRPVPVPTSVKQPGDVVRHLAHRGPTTFTAVTLRMADVARVQGEGRAVAIPQLEIADERAAPFHRLIDAACAGVARGCGRRSGQRARGDQQRASGLLASGPPRDGVHPRATG